MWGDRIILVIATAALAFACPARALRPTQRDEATLRTRIAQAEARRGDGLAELIALANHGATRHERSLALRGLGRIGGTSALATLAAALRDRDPEIVGVAASSIGIASSLDDDTAGDAALTAALVTALATANQHQPEVIEAIGRTADATAQRALVEKLADPATRTAAATALGRYGRRKIALSQRAGMALVQQLVARPKIEATARYAIAWAFARRHVETAETDPMATAAIGPLAELLADEVAEVRAQAASALGRRKWVKPVQRALIGALDDADWRVAVEAVRALTGDGDDSAQFAVASAALARFDRIVNGEPRQAHVVLEALVGLVPHAERADLAAVLRDLAARAGSARAPDSGTRLAVAWIECRAIAAAARAEAAPDYDAVAACGHNGLPDHLRLPLLGELITAKVGSLASRRAALRTLLAHDDPRVRVAGIAGLAALWQDGDDVEHRAAITTVTTAIGSSDPIISGNAIDAATALYEVVDRNVTGAIDAAVVARAEIEHDPELAAALFELIGKRTIAAGAPACRAGRDGAPVLARAAAACLKALHEPVPPVAMIAAKPPVLDLDAVIGQRVRWHLMTTRGELVIALQPDAAPWAVAAIVTLTRNRFYDGLELHRVVPDFVAQGGDPTQSGWGGPGFTLPAEPSTGAGFAMGGVGIADAGRDSGGSQWFVMHSAAPHLDGRYTWIGAVESGQNSADALLIGDKVIRAMVEVTPE